LAFFAALFSFMVLVGSFFTVFLLSILLLMLFTPYAIFFMGDMKFPLDEKSIKRSHRYVNKKGVTSFLLSFLPPVNAVLSCKIIKPTTLKKRRIA
jgi:hypothetical protein